MCVCVCVCVVGYQLSKDLHVPKSSAIIIMMWGFDAAAVTAANTANIIVDL